MAKDIEEFLRRAAERRRQQQAGQGGAGESSPPPAQRSSPAKRPVQAQRSVPPQPPRRAPSREEPMVIEDVEIIQSGTQPQRDLRSQSVGEHVRTHLDTTELARHAEALGDRIGQIGEQVETRVHRNLDHDLSTVDDKPTITDEPTPVIVGGETNQMVGKLRRMLGNPASVGQAILVAEILKLPDFD